MEAPAKLGRPDPRPVGSLLSLGIHLAALGGLNLEVYGPGLVQVLRVGFYISLPVAFIVNIYILLNARSRLTIGPLPIWLRMGLLGV